MHAVKQYSPGRASPGGANSKVVGPLGSAAADAESAKSHPAGLIRVHMRCEEIAAPKSAPLCPIKRIPVPKRFYLLPASWAPKREGRTYYPGQANKQMNCPGDENAPPMLFFASSRARFSALLSPLGCACVFKARMTAAPPLPA